MTYLRVKKWKDWQHYKDREPPWVKLWGKLLHDDKFLELSEAEQWQLVRVWMVVSLATRFTLDEEGRVVPVVANDESMVRRAIGSLRRVPLGKFVQAGWLLEVAAKDTFDASAVLAQPPQKPVVEDAVNGAGDSALLEVEVERVEKFSSSFKGSPRPDRPGLPVNDHLLEKLVTVCGSSCDRGTRAVLRSYAKRLPEASLAKVLETTAQQPTHVRARYANGALQSELQERAVG